MTEILDLGQFRVKEVRRKDGHLVIDAYCPDPYCRDQRGHVEIDVGKGVFYCHKCGKGGKVSGTLYEHAVHPSPIQRCIQRPPRRFADLHPHPLVEYLRPTDPASDRMGMLRQRGSCETQIGMLEPCFIADGPLYLPRYDRYAWFPVYDREGRLIYTVGRAIHPDTMPKYLYPPASDPMSFGASDVLVGINSCGFGGSVYLVEGIFDRIWDDNRLAILGSKELSEVQMEQLKGLAHHTIYICMDGDEAGRRAAGKLRTQLLRHFPAVSFLQIKIVPLPEGEDPDSMGRNGYRNAYLRELADKDSQQE